MSSRLAPIGKTRTISTQRYTFTFQPNSAEYNAQTVEAAGKISDISAPSGTKVFKAISSSPFQQQVSRGDSVAEGDILQVELDATPTQEETVEIVVSYSDIAESKTLPEDLGGEGLYRYDINLDDDNVTCLNLNTEQIVGTIAFPSGFDKNNFSIHYRHQDQSIHLFDGRGTIRDTVIDANPATNNFNTIKNSFSLSLNGKSNSKQIEFNSSEDFFLEFGGGGDDGSFTTFDADGNILFDSGLKEFGPAVKGIFYSFSLNIVSGELANKNAFFKITPQAYEFLGIGPSIGFNRSSGGQYNPNNGLIYLQTTAVSVFEPTSFTEIARINGFCSFGGLSIDPDNNVAYQGNTDNGNDQRFIDCSTNTKVFSKRYGKMEFPTYSKKTGLLYARLTGTNRLFKFDLSKAKNGNDPKVGEITIGNQPLVADFALPKTAAVTQLIL